VSHAVTISPRDNNKIVDNLSVRQAIGEPPPGEGETLVDRKTRCGRSLFHIVKVGAGVKREISKDEQNG